VDNGTNEITLQGEFGPEEIIEEHVYSWKSVGANQDVMAQRIAFESGRRHRAVLAVLLLGSAIGVYAVFGSVFAAHLLLFFGIFLLVLSFASPGVDPAKIEASERRLRLMIMMSFLTQVPRYAWYVGERTQVFDENGVTGSLGWLSQSIEWSSMTSLWESERSLAFDCPAGFWVVPKRWCGSEEELDDVRSMMRLRTGLEFQTINTEKIVDDCTPLAIEAFEKEEAKAASSRT
jgi:hypothetical protein